MKNLDKHEWDLNKDERYAINWLENRNYSVTITKRYMTKTIMQAQKDGITDELHLTFGEKNLGHTAMEQFERTFEIKRENIRLKEELKKIKKQGGNLNE